MPPLRIFVAYDDDLTRSVISALLAFRRDWQICGEASDGRTAIQQVELLRPDITLIDSEMPEVDGCEATRQIVLRDPSHKVIVLTNGNEEKTNAPFSTPAPWDLSSKRTRPTTCPTP